ncbi:MAG: sortase [Actinomycetota bacterium]
MSDDETTNPASRKARVLLRLITAVAATLLLVGAGVLAHPYYTDLQANRTQQTLAAEFSTAEVKEAYVQKEVPEGTPVTRLRIPKLGVDTMVVEGASEESLRSGAARYSDTSLPGEPGNVGIAGHRTTYGKPFNELDRLEPGDQVLLDTPLGPYVYEMVEPFDGHANPWVVPPHEIEVIDPTAKPSLTLTTCHPKGSDRQRLIARLELVETPGNS